MSHRSDMFPQSEPKYLGKNRIMSNEEWERRALNSRKVTYVVNSRNNEVYRGNFRQASLAMLNTICEGHTCTLEILTE